MAKIKLLPDPKIAARLHALMKKSKTLTNQELIAKKAGVGQRTIGRILNSEVSSSMATYAAICAAFGVPSDALTNPNSEYDPLLSGVKKEAFNKSSYVAVLSKEDILQWTKGSMSLQDNILANERRTMSTSLATNPESHFLLVEDDSMLYDLPKGCWVHIDPSKEPVRGKIVEAITKTGDIVFRTYKPLSNGGYELIANNNLYDALQDSDIEKIVGVKVEYRVIDPDYTE